MRAIILAAGMGTRLQPLTHEIPKCLLKIGSKSILGHQLIAYDNEDIQEIVVVAGYKFNQVNAECEIYNQRLSADISTIQNRDFQTTDNMYSLYIALENYSGPFVVSNGDVFCSDVIWSEATSGLDTSIAFYDSSIFDEEALQLKLNNGKPCSILPKGSEDGHGSTIGIFTLNSRAGYLLYQELNRNIKFDEINSWFEISLSSVLTKAEFDAIDVRNEYWIEIDTVEDLAKARRVNTKYID